MNAGDRVALYESLLDTFLTRAKEGGYLIVEVAGKPDEYVQYAVHDGRVLVEVGSRQWQEPERPLPVTAVSGLAALGFTGGGPERNFQHGGLAPSAGELARLTEDLILTAYDPPDGYSPLVREMHLNDVTPPRAEPFTRDMIEAHLRDHGASFLRDQDGDFRVDLECAGDEEPVTVWFVAGGPGDAVYRVAGLAQRRPRPPSRMEALERCNAWNAASHAPTAAVVGGEDDWRIVVTAEVDLGEGIPRPLFDAWTHRAVGGILAFWSALAGACTAHRAAGDEREGT